MTEDEILQRFLEQTFGEANLGSDFDALLENEKAAIVDGDRGDNDDLMIGADYLYEQAEGAISFADWVTEGVQSGSITNAELYDEIPKEFHLYMTSNIINGFALTEVETFQTQKLESFFQCIILKEFFGVGSNSKNETQINANKFIKSLRETTDDELRRILSIYIPEVDVYELQEIAIAVIMLLKEFYEIVDDNEEGGLAEA